MTSARKAKARIVEMMASTDVVMIREQWGDGAPMAAFLRLQRKPGAIANALREVTRTPGLSHAILIGHEVKACNLMTWARWMEAKRKMTGERGGTGLHVADEVVGNARVSTIFLGVNHAFGFGRPLWFETMVFIRDYNGDADMDRYSTWEEAEAGHAAMVQRHRSPDPSGWMLDRMLRDAEDDMDKEDAP